LTHRARRTAARSAKVQDNRCALNRLTASFAARLVAAAALFATAAMVTPVAFSSQFRKNTSIL